MIKAFRVVNEVGLVVNASVGEVKAVLGLIVPVTAPTPTTTYVSTITQLQMALSSGDKDITVTASITAPAGGVNVPRDGRTLRCDANGILVRGSTSGNVLRSDGTGGTLKLSGFRVDGGWRSNPHEDDDNHSNYFVPNFDFLRIEDSVSCYSLRTGYFAPRCKKIELVRSTMFACPRDHLWAWGCPDVLVENCLIQHCGDDSMGAHLGDAGFVVRSMIYRNNLIRDAFGGKLHAGSADGTINGKPGQVRFENNIMEACGLYGVHGEGDNAVEVNGDPRNIFFVNNRVENLRRNTPSSGGQQLGYGVRYYFPGRTYSNVHIENNTFVRSIGVQGTTLQSVYSWAQLNSPDKPQNVPGAGAFQGFFNKTGFLPNALFDLASVGTVLVGNNVGDIVHSDNTFAGTWSNVIA